MITTKTYKTREEFIKDRSKEFVIGSSTIGTILGLDRHKSPYQVWYDWQNREESTMNANKYRGTFMERGILDWFCHETGEKLVQKSAGITVYKNSKYPDYMQVAPDGELFAKGRKSRPIVECKDTRYTFKDIEDLKAKQPNWYAQGQWQMGHMERDDYYLAICDGNKELKYFHFNFDNVYFETLLTNGTTWYEYHIGIGEAPEMTTEEDYKLMFPTIEERYEDIGNEGLEICREFKRLKLSEKVIQDQIKQQRVEVLKLFNGADALGFEKEVIATYRQDVRGVRTLKVY